VAVCSSAAAQGETVILAPGYRARICGGSLASLSAREGPELLGSLAFRHNFYRAATDNDRCGVDFFVPWAMRLPFVPGILQMTGNLSFSVIWRRAGLDKLQSVVDSCIWGTLSGSPSLTVSERYVVGTSNSGRASGRALFRTQTVYTFGPAQVTIAVRVEALSPVMRMATLPRIGCTLVAAPELSTLEWLGCGPGESYADRKAAADWAIHRRSVDDQHVDYVVPTENGGKADVHWAALTNPEPPHHGLLLQYFSLDDAPEEEQPGDMPAERHPAGTKGAQLNVSRRVIKELDAARHRHELPVSDVLQDCPIQVHIDAAHAGIGGAGEGGAKLWATASQFLIDPTESPWTYTMLLRPISSETWGVAT